MTNEADKITIIKRWTDHFVSVEITGGTYYCTINYDKSNFYWSTKMYTRLTDAVDGAYIMVSQIAYNEVKAMCR